MPFFLKGEIILIGYVVYKHIKRCTILLINREMQFRIAVTIFCFQNDKVRKNDDIQYCHGFRKNGYSPTILDEIINCLKIFRELIWQYVLKTLKICLPLWLSKDIYKVVQRCILKFITLFMMVKTENSINIHH